MLTSDDVYDLAEKHNLRARSYWSTQQTHGREVPKLVEISLFFPEQNPEVWKLLMTTETEVLVRVKGTRQTTGSGATDDTFYPCYLELLPEVNAVRKQLGWDALRN